MSKKNDITLLKEGDSREIIIYHDGSNNAPKVEVLLQHQNLWLTQKALATLFECERACH